MEKKRCTGTFDHEPIYWWTIWKELKNTGNIIHPCLIHPLALKNFLMSLFVKTLIASLYSASMIYIVWHTDYNFSLFDINLHARLISGLWEISEANVKMFFNLYSNVKKKCILRCLLFWSKTNLFFGNDFCQILFKTTLNIILLR